MLPALLLIASTLSPEDTQFHAQTWLAARIDELGIAKLSDLQVHQISGERIEFMQSIGGVHVVNSLLRLRVTADGVEVLANELYRNPKFDAKPRLSEQEAMRAAVAEVSRRGHKAEATRATLSIEGVGQDPYRYLAWIVHVQIDGGESYYIHVDAKSGAVHRFERLQTCGGAID